MPASANALAALQTKIWSGSIALEIRLAASDCRTYDVSEPYLVQFPRLSYLGFLLPRLHAFFTPSLITPEVSAHDAWISFEGVPMKWHYPLGLLYDLFSGAEPLDLDPPGLSDPAESSILPSNSTAVATIPWKLVIHYSDFPDEQLIQLDAEGRTMQDTYVNAVKEADFVRNGTARTVMSMSKDDSDNLWLAVQNHDRPLFNTVNNKILNPPGLTLRHVPIKIYLPTTGKSEATETIEEETTPAHLRVVQALVPIVQASKQPQTLGTALNTVLPTIFPSRRSPIYARPVLHGAAVPLGARLDDLGRAAAYTDGFLHLAIVMHG
ncbi:Putative autophagy protein Atg5, UblA [Septoria linicola]|uniref:Autophagy protein 5 n=1 Tax=Septoria linicola TaxID=215465 RepID=A0A9Q9AZ49_9PEZI|nr:Putative autophagy protein Atg5, UblA [Septoria linicola]